MPHSREDVRQRLPERGGREDDDVTCFGVHSPAMAFLRVSLSIVERDVEDFFFISFFVSSFSKNVSAQQRANSSSSRWSRRNGSSTTMSFAEDPALEDVRNASPSWGFFLTSCSQ